MSQIMRGDEMAGYGEHRQPAGIPAERTVEKSTRPAWAKPEIRRFSLQKTLTGSGVYFDGGVRGSQPSPT